MKAIKVVHFLTAFALLMKGIAKLEHPHGVWPVIVFFFAASAWIVVITLLHDRLHHHARLLTASVYAIECVATAIVALLYFREGKHALPFVYAAASIGFAVALAVHLTRTRGGGNAAHGKGVEGA